ncbi:BTAD domain-containing putative transcriptional regulator [Nonomuraea longicatena]|uniref:BTAD domain-containing putative transcriptional regulator n=1 Tax=Nonomuraea longicatena TaxID=83682 RepID=A0ABP4ANR9_9ACTN
MRFGILGPVQVRDGEVRGARPRAVLAMLMLSPGRVVPMSALIDGQYGEAPPDGAANAIQAAVSRLRRGLPEGVVESRRAGYVLAVDPDEVDAYRFERLGREGRAQLAAGEYERAARTLKQALGLWRGPALADVPDIPFAEDERARLGEVLLTVREDLAEAELSAGTGTSVPELMALTAAHPTRERLRGQLMRALYAEGRQAEALGVYEDGRRLLAERLGADPSPQLSELHVAMLRGDTGGGRKGVRAPAQLTAFVGRDAELRRLADLGEVRLVTITGPGGVGKTRLAVESAPGAYFADLAALDDGAQVPQALLVALGLRETGLHSPAAGGPDATGRLLDALADQRLTLVLDNCEHLINPVSALVRRLLDACPGLRVIATSREPLGLTGERLLTLAPLPVPPPGTTEDISDFPAVRLFLDRAAAVRSDPPDPDRAAEICTLLDGLPLAIELAAARLRTFTADDLAARLAEDGRFALLTRGDRTAAARHRTLHAAVDWSWSLLTEEERVVAKRLSVFAGGASLEAVERVCGSADVLADLVDRSLVEAEGGRYRMSETIRLFCAGRLDPAEAAQARAGHLTYFLDLAERAEPWLRRAEQREWLARLGREDGNLRAALRYAVENDRPKAFRLIAALAAYSWLSGRRDREAVRLLAGPVPDGLDEEYAICVLRAAPEATEEQWARATEIIWSLGRELRYPFLTVLWGMVVGPPARDTGWQEATLGGDPWSQAVAVLGRALVRLLDGAVAEAEAELEQALSVFTTLGERWGTAQALEWLALIASWRGEWARAHHRWGRAVDLHAELGDSDEMADVLCRRAAGSMREGDLAAAESDLRRAAALTRGRSAQVPLWFGELARHRGEPERAREHLRAALAAKGSGYVVDGVKGLAALALGRLAEADGDLIAARRHHRTARTLLTSSADLAEVATGQAGLALLESATESTAESAAERMAVSPAESGVERIAESPAEGTTEGTAKPGRPERAVNPGLLKGAEHAALLLGVSVALRGTTVAGDRDTARVYASARQILGPTACAELFAQGAAMSGDEALTVLW